MTTPSSEHVPLLEVRRIFKAFPGVQALAEVDLRLDEAEVLGIVGENGAGKSTLMKILGGVYTPDQGEIRLDGKPVEIDSVQAAQMLGITLIHQELNLAENLDIAANLFLGCEPTWAGKLRLLDRRVYVDAAELIGRLGLECSPRTLVGRLSVGQQQLVEIARALSNRCRVLIMDEPTSSLTQRETDRLYEVIRDLKRDGVSVLYISHRLEEVKQITDRVCVLRDGRNAGELAGDQINHDNLVRLMVGRELKQFFQRTASTTAPAADKSDDSGNKAKPVLKVRGLRRAGEKLSTPAIDFEIRPGEIVGMAGLMGAGRTELAETLFGIRRLVAGRLELDGKRLRIRTPREAIAAGIYLVPEDRRYQGLVLADTVKNNISLASLDHLNRFRLVALGRERELAQETCRRLSIRTPDIRQTVGLLSGGNQQKVVLGKWLCRTPRLLILDEPTRGVDVGAKAEIYALMDRLAADGVGVLMISSDLEEILGMSDRVLVMHEGCLAGELSKAEMNEQSIMQLATGGGK